MKSWMAKFALAAVCAVLQVVPTTANAAMVQIPAPQSIVHYYAYTTYNGGDVVFKLETNITGCEDGYWIKSSNPGFERAYSTLISAYFSSRKVTVVVDNADLWPGSTGAYCRLDAIGIYN